MEEQEAEVEEEEEEEDLLKPRSKHEGAGDAGPYPSELRCTINTDHKIGPAECAERLNPPPPLRGHWRAEYLVLCLSKTHLIPPPLALRTPPRRPFRALPRPR